MSKQKQKRKPKSKFLLSFASAFILLAVSLLVQSKDLLYECGTGLDIGLSYVNARGYPAVYLLNTTATECTKTHDTLGRSLEGGNHLDVQTFWGLDAGPIHINASTLAIDYTIFYAISFLGLSLWSASARYRK